MTDLTSLFYGVLATLTTLIVLKIVDIVLEHFLDKTVFSKVWAAITKSVKKFQTRWNPIVICFQFRIKLEPSTPTKIKENLIKVVESLSERNKGQVAFSALTWTDTDNAGSVNAAFNKREFRIDMNLSYEYRNYDPEKEIFKDNEEISEFSDSVAFSIEVNFPFKSIDPMLLSLSSLTNIIGEQLKETFPIVEFSKGLFVIAPIKADFTMDHWIKDKQFDVSLLLRAKEKILVNLYPKKAEIIFPTLQIDEKVSEYLKATILNYYL